MKTLAALSVIALAFAGNVASANPAHHPSPAGPADAARPGGVGMMGTACPMMGGHAEGSLAFLKTELKITDAQTPAWNSFAEAYRAFATSRPAMMMQGGGMMAGGKGGGGGMMNDGPMAKGQSPMPYPDRMKGHMQMMQDYLAAGQKFQPTVDALYAALSAEQRKTADELLPMFTMMGGMK